MILHIIICKGGAYPRVRSGGAPSALNRHNCIHTAAVLTIAMFTPPKPVSLNRKSDFHKTNIASTPKYFNRSNSAKLFRLCARVMICRLSLLGSAKQRTLARHLTLTAARSQPNKRIMTVETFANNVISYRIYLLYRHLSSQVMHVFILSDDK